MTATQKLTQMSQIIAKYRQEADAKVRNLSLGELVSERQRYDATRSELIYIYARQMAQAELAELS